MKATELIARLADLVAQVGDVPVLVDARNGFGFRVSVSPNVVVNSNVVGHEAIHVVFRDREGDNVSSA